MFCEQYFLPRKPEDEARTAWTTVRDSAKPHSMEEIEMRYKDANFASLRLRLLKTCPECQKEFSPM
jgi:hypothetical protein